MSDPLPVMISRN